VGCGWSPTSSRPAAGDSPQPLLAEASAQSFWPPHFSFHRHWVLRQANVSPGQLPGDSKAWVTGVFCSPPSHHPSHRGVLVTAPQRLCGVEPGAKLQPLLSLWGERGAGPWGTRFGTRWGTNASVSAAGPPARRRLQVGLRSAATALPAAGLLPDFSPGLWGETSLGPATKRKEGESAGLSQSGPQELCAPRDGAAPGLAGDSLHLLLLPGSRFPCPTASGELLAPFPYWGLSPVCPTVGTEQPTAALRAFGAILAAGRNSRELWQRAAAPGQAPRPKRRGAAAESRGVSARPPAGLREAPGHPGTLPVVAGVQRVLQRNPHLRIFQAQVFFKSAGPGVLRSRPTPQSLKERRLPSQVLSENN